MSVASVVSSDPGALAAYWELYERYYDEVTASTRGRFASHPELGPLMAAMTPEQQEAQSRHSRELMRAAILDGQWDAYDAHLRVQGETYAHMGLSFATWFEILNAFQHFLVPKIVDAYLAEPVKLSAVLSAMTATLDHAMQVIGGQYVKIQADLAEARAVELNAERERHAAIARRARAVEEDSRLAREANRLKSEFLANMSHELRTPLNAIIGFAELLESGQVGPDSPRYQGFVQHILRSGTHLLELINGILDLAKVESGKMDFHYQAVDVSEIVDEVVGILRTIASNKRIPIDVEVEPGAGEIVADTARFKQVLYNYLSNAIKFTPPEGRVSVTVSCEGADHIRLAVRDTGPGIAQADLARLFVEFQQLDSSASKEHQGTGLGLALTKRIVEAQGGTVSAESTLGQGSVFRAILPRRPVAEHPVDIPPSPEVTAAGEELGPVVLVVEDEPADREWLVRVLREAQYSVEVARTAAEALMLCETRHYAAITLDMLLPDKSGLDVLARVRDTDGPNRDTPVIVVTVVSERGTISGFAVQDYLVKPVQAETLLRALVRAGVAPGSDRPVMVIDDDRASLDLAEEALGRQAISVSLFQDATGALLAVGREAPAAIVLDLMMPGLDGFSFLDRLRSTEAGRAIPVIIWTTKDLSAQEYRRLREGTQAVVLKRQGGATALVQELRSVMARGGRSPVSAPGGSDAR